MNKLFLLDAYALIYRAFYALMKSPRVNSKGFNTSTVFGFVNTLVEILTKDKPDLIGVAFDPKGPTFRHKAFPQYKAQREKTPEGIQESVPIIKDIIKACNIPIFEVMDYEADDVIGTLATKAEQAGYLTYMITPDKDYCQLVSDKIFVYKPSHGKSDSEILGPKEVNTKYDLYNPLQVIDLLGLMGDASDNVPGCPGVGPKTAITLIKKYHSIEGIYNHLHELKGKLKEGLEINKEQVLFSKFLVTIKKDVPIELDEEKLKRKEIDKTALKKIFDELEFRTLIKRICEPEKNIQQKKSQISNQQPDLFSEFLDNSQEKSNKPILKGEKQAQTNYEIVETKEERRQILSKILSEKIVSLDFATTTQTAIRAEIVGMAFYTENHDAFYIPINGGIFSKEDVEDFRPFFENEEIIKVAYDLKYLILVLANYGIQLKGKLFDVMLAHYVIQPEQRHSMENIANTYLHTDTITLENQFGARWRDSRNMESISVREAADFTSQRANYALRLKPLLEAELHKNNERILYENIELPLISVLAKMEHNGVLINTHVLEEISGLFSARLKEYEQKVYKISGQQFNPSSPKQVGEILFDVMKLDEKAKRTKSGQYDTSEAVLEALQNKSPIIEYILEYRGMKKLLNTYVDSLPTLVNPQTGHIHTSFNQAVTATGRLSSSDPNLQNIPVRGEDGKEIRKAFIPESGCEFFSADYSQIELRIMAHLSNDEHMLEAFNEGLDIHAATAAKVFHKSIEEVSPDERRKAKTANFGIIYGISAFGLSQRIGVSRGEAKNLIDNYFETFPQIKLYTEQIVKLAQEQGFVETIFHRRRYLPDINSRNGQVRKFSERNAVNAPIQGSAADIIKVAMIRIAKRFEEEKIRSKMILQVHDELNFSVYPEEHEIVEKIVKYEMAHACKLHVPLLADCGWGKNWLEAH